MDLKQISVTYEYTNNVYRSLQWLKNLPDLFAADFEIASKFSLNDKELNKTLLNQDYPKKVKRVLLQEITSDGLSHPSLTTITHLSIASSESEGKVIIFDDKSDNGYLRNTVLDFLVTTDKTQIWHNCQFDFKHIYYYKKKIPKNFIDTQLLAKSLITDADSMKNRFSLKELMAYAYGTWAISKDNFTLAEMWDEDLIKYAATDSCATYKLYKDILYDLNKWSI